MSRIDQFMEIESRDRRWREGRIWSNKKQVWGFFWRDGNVPKLESGDGCTTLEIF